MSGSNSRNMSLIIFLFVVSIFVFAYVIFSNNIEDTITTDVGQFEYIDDEEE